ncbi:MAG TPA: nicotinamide-nucleotide amidohydrolase family protein [bacterium]
MNEKRYERRRRTTNDRVPHILKDLQHTLTSRGLTISVCESCTGGMLGSMITSRSGSSAYFLGGIIAYANTVKQRVVGVRSRTLLTSGAVSARTAREMAQHVRQITGSDIGISITGIAGPAGGTRSKPVGLVYVSAADKNVCLVQRFQFHGSRAFIRKNACLGSLQTLKALVSKGKAS